MTKEQAKKEYEKIILDRNKKADLIIKEAKEKGVWKPGLDSNNHLFKEIDAEAKRQIELISSQIDN